MFLSKINHDIYFNTILLLHHFNDHLHVLDECYRSFDKHRFLRKPLFAMVTFVRFCILMLLFEVSFEVSFVAKMTHFFISNLNIPIRFKCCVCQARPFHALIVCAKTSAFFAKTPFRIHHICDVLLFHALLLYECSSSFLSKTLSH